MQNQHKAKTACYSSIHDSVYQTMMLLAALCVLLFAPLAHAQQDSQATEQRLDQLYNELLANPGDVDKTLAYAELAVELGDYEAAIPPLERLLLKNPNSNKLKLELGIMYYLLGSYDTAKTYLLEVKNSGNAPRDFVAQADTYLSKM